MKRIIVIFLILFISAGFFTAIVEANDSTALSPKVIFTTGLTENNEPVTVLKDVLVNGGRVYIYVTNQKEISINEPRIYIYIKWGSISKVEHNYLCKIFDGGGRLVSTSNSSIKPDTEDWKTWTWYDIKKNVDKPGNWKYEVYLDNKQVLEEYLAVKEEKLSKSCLWRIKTGNNSVYFLGAIHILKKEVYPLNESIEKAFEESKLLAFEIDFESENNEETQRNMEVKGTLPKESTLEKSLSKETYRFVKEVLKKLRLDISQFNQYKPWYFGLILSDIRYEELGFKGKYGIDNYFFSKAKEAGREIIGLETLEDRSNILDDMPAESQELYIFQALLGDKYLMENELDAVQIAWQSGDIVKMEDIALRDFKQDPEFHNALIVKRNNNWLPKIRLLLKENKNCMVIVGAAHLVGENGLLEILRKEGYTVEQL